jgi:hypothetical protein
MTASQLIEQLQKFPPDMHIMIRGYEEGYNHIFKLIPRKLQPHPEQDKDYYGEFIDVKSDEPDVFDAVELFGENSKSLNP